MLRHSHNRRVAARALFTATLIGVSAAAFFGTRTWAEHSQRAKIRPTQQLPSDVATEVATVRAHFDRTFSARLRCIDDVSLTLVSDVPGGDARYLVPTRTIEVEIPTTPARFRESVAHELAHHIEHTCDEFSALRFAFHPLVAQPWTEWNRPDEWYESPSERWAEAATEAMLGERIRHVEEMPVTAEMLDLVTRWGSGVSLDSDEDQPTG